VQTNTVSGPGMGAAVLRVKGTKKLLAVTVDGNGLWCRLDPREGTRMLVAEAARNLVAVGAQPLAVTNNLNFGNPRKPEIAWEFAESIHGLGDACRAFETPVTGGNVSLYNESTRTGVFPTPVIGMVGQLDGPSEVMRPGFVEEGDVIFEIGPRAIHAGGSRILRDLEGELVGPPPGIDLELEKRVQKFALTVIRGGLVHNAQDIGEGGMLIALLEMFLNARPSLGCRIDMPAGHSPVPVLLSEEPSRFLVCVTDAERADLAELAASANVPLHPVGVVTRDNLFTIDGICRLHREELEAAYYTEPYPVKRPTPTAPTTT
jgi:phosphoribosylformylglycinamidine synthase